MVPRNSTGAVARLAVAVKPPRHGGHLPPAPVPELNFPRLAELAPGAVAGVITGRLLRERRALPGVSRRHEISRALDGMEHVPAEELLRRQGVRPVESAGELGCPDLFESDEELGEFLAMVYSDRRTGLA